MHIGKVEKLEETLDLDLDIDSDGDLCKAIASKETDRQVEDLESNLVMKIAQIHRVINPPGESHTIAHFFKSVQNHCAIT